MQRTKITTKAKGKGNTVIGTFNHYACPHCGSPPQWIRLLAMAGLLLAMAPWLAAVTPGAFPADWPHKFASVAVVTAAVCVLAACFKSYRWPWQPQTQWEVE